MLEFLFGTENFGLATVLFGIVYNFLPFMILPLYTSIQKIDKSLLEASQDLGATEWQTIRKVVFPMSLPGLASGFVMVFVPSITTFVVAQYFSAGRFLLIGNFIENDFMGTVRMEIGAAVSFIVLLFVFATMFLINKINKNANMSEGIKKW
jgi:spermidine/putrescine transport system permease protein